MSAANTRLFWHLYLALHLLICQFRASDGGVFRGTTLWEALENNTLGVPPATPFPGDNQPVPYSIVAE